MRERKPFGKLLRQTRRDLGVTQRVLAARVEMDTAYLSRLETGGINPGRVTIRKLAKALGLEEAQTEELIMAAGRIPERYEATILERPVMLELIAHAARMTDSKVRAMMTGKGL
jgi:transcriptional regulator with XRE-family HTH domain